jgi:hypothetical protein
MKSNAHWRYTTLLAAIDRAYGPLGPRPDTTRPTPRPAAALPR